MPKKERRRSALASPRQKSLLEMFSSSPGTSQRLKPSAPKGKGKRLPSKDLSPESDVVPIESPIAKKRQRRTYAKFEKESEEDSDSSDVGRIKFEDRLSSVHSVDDESDSHAGPSTQVRHARRRRLLTSDSEEKLEPENSDIENRGVELVQPRSSRIKQGRVVETDSDQPKPNKPKRRLTKGIRPPSDNEDPMDGIQKDQIIESRLRGRPKQSKFMRNLEKLKRKKRGETASSTDESEEEADEDDQDVPFMGARPDWGEKEEEEDIDGFIVEDDGDVQLTNLPAAFSMNTHQDLAHHFKIVCQYHVHLAVAEDHKRKKIAKQLSEDEYFSVPIAITRRKLADLRDTIASSVWRPAYKKALQKYPEFNLSMLDFAIPQCDACHLGGRMSKFMARLGGSPYNKNTFRALHDNSPTNSDSEEENLSRELHLGRWCAQRTEIFHELCHWEYKLFQNLSREVKELLLVKQGLSRMVYSHEPPDDPTDGDEVMDWLDRREVISLEWTIIKSLISRASNLDSDVKGGKAVD